jgi:hypothetical protein
MQIWNKNWMWWNLSTMNHIQFMVIHKYHDLFSECNLEEMTLTNVGFSVSFIHSAISFHKWSHSHVAHVFPQAIVFYLLHWSVEKGLLKTRAFINVWSWQQGLSHQVDGCLGFLGSMERLCSWCKHHIRCISSFNLANKPMPSFSQVMPSWQPHATCLPLN